VKARNGSWRRAAKTAGILPVAVALLGDVAFSNTSFARCGSAVDEARCAGRDAASLPIATEPYFRDMDGGILLSQAAVEGRNTWMIWTAGNDRFWDLMTTSTFGAFDLLKIVAYDPSERTTKDARDKRWRMLGLINEPCFDPPDDGDPDRFGLKLDVRRADCEPDPFENEQKYPGVVIGARGKELPKWGRLPVGSLYGYASGIVGLRLFPNPDFDEAAAALWDPVRYFNDPRYYRDPSLVRPYRVGMSCGFCHVGPSPVHPPDHPESPRWTDLSSTVGAQYMKVNNLFVYDRAEDNFIYQLVSTYRPGTMDTSLVSTDNINNPRTMNAIYSTMSRLDLANRWGRETLSGHERDNKQFNDYIGLIPAEFTRFFEKPGTVWAPHILKDGSDSVGVLGALNRVYLNIGAFSEEWLKHFNAFAGGAPITPIRITVAEKSSTYWQATEAWTPYVALFLLEAARPDRLADAPGGARYLSSDPPTLDRGKTVFAETCARCHSSKAPQSAVGLDSRDCGGRGYLKCWDAYWRWTQTSDYKRRMNAIVHAPDFLEGNFLSTDVRVPVTLLQTNACSPLATNAIRGNIWDNFSSDSYKSLPSVGSIIWYDPFTGEPHEDPIPDGGRGYTRPPSLISVWSSAPFLLNNSLGKFTGDPSVAGRMDAFEDAIRKLLWPEMREKDALLPDKVPGVIDRTTAKSFIRIAPGYVPAELRRLAKGRLHDIAPRLFDADGGITVGPIPKGVPIDLLANLQPLPETSDPKQQVVHWAQVIQLLVELKATVATLPDDPTTEELMKLSDLARTMLRLDKCRDFVVNRGHYFGTDKFPDEPPLSDADKLALIEFLKTF
jgi:hypothetical protein